MKKVYYHPEYDQLYIVSEQFGGSMFTLEWEWDDPSQKCDHCGALRRVATTATTFKSLKELGYVYIGEF